MCSSFTDNCSDDCAVECTGNNECPLCHFQLASPDCEYCAAGYYLANSTSPPTCLSCPAGSWSNVDAQSCTLCDAGQYSTVVAATYFATCQSCSIGTFNTAPGQTSCIACAPGLSTATAAATSCTQATSASSSSSAGTTIGAAVGASVGAVLLIIVIIAVVVYRRHHKATGFSRTPMHNPSFLVLQSDTLNARRKAALEAKHARETPPSQSDRRKENSAHGFAMQPGAEEPLPDLEDRESKL